jgi:hypothetical protein
MNNFEKCLSKCKYEDIFVSFSGIDSNSLRIIEEDYILNNVLLIDKNNFYIYN